MIAKGADASDYFPAVVKNVVAKNTEVWQQNCFVVPIPSIALNR